MYLNGSSQGSSGTSPIKSCCEGTKSPQTPKLLSSEFKRLGYGGEGVGKHCRYPESLKIH